MSSVTGTDRSLRIPFCEGSQDEDNEDAGSIGVRVDDDAQFPELNPILDSESRCLQDKFRMKFLMDNDHFSVIHSDPWSVVFAMGDNPKEVSWVFPSHLNRLNVMTKSKFVVGRKYFRGTNEERKLCCNKTPLHKLRNVLLGTVYARGLMMHLRLVVLEADFDPDTPYLTKSEMVVLVKTLDEARKRLCQHTDSLLSSGGSHMHPFLVKSEKSNVDIDLTPPRWEEDNDEEDEDDDVFEGTEKKNEERYLGSPEDLSLRSTLPPLSAQRFMKLWSEELDRVSDSDDEDVESRKIAHKLRNSSQAVLFVAGNKDSCVLGLVEENHINQESLPSLDIPSADVRDDQGDDMGLSDEDMNKSVSVLLNEFVSREAMKWIKMMVPNLKDSKVHVYMDVAVSASTTHNGQTILTVAKRMKKHLDILMKKFGSIGWVDDDLNEDHGHSSRGNIASSNGMSSGPAANNGGHDPINRSSVDSVEGNNDATTEVERTTGSRPPGEGGDQRRRNPPRSSRSHSVSRSGLHAHVVPPEVDRDRSSFRAAGDVGTNNSNDEGGDLEVSSNVVALDDNLATNSEAFVGSDDDSIPSSDEDSVGEILMDPTYEYHSEDEDDPLEADDDSESDDDQSTGALGSREWIKMDRKMVSTRGKVSTVYSNMFLPWNGNIHTGNVVLMQDMDDGSPSGGRRVRLRHPRGGHLVGAQFYLDGLNVAKQRKQPGREKLMEFPRSVILALRGGMETNEDDPGKAEALQSVYSLLSNLKRQASGYFSYLENLSQLPLRMEYTFKVDNGSDVLEVPPVMDLSRTCTMVDYEEMVFWMQKRVYPALTVLCSVFGKLRSNLLATKDIPAEVKMTLLWSAEMLTSEFSPKPYEGILYRRMRDGAEGIDALGYMVVPDKFKILTPSNLKNDWHVEYGIHPSILSIDVGPISGIQRRFVLPVTFHGLRRGDGLFRRLKRRTLDPVGLESIWNRLTWALFVVDRCGECHFVSYLNISNLYAFLCVY